MPLVLSGSTGIVEANIADSAITTNKIAASNITAAKLASGAARTNFGAGAVLQVQQTYSDIVFNTGSSSDVATGILVNITPISASSKILIMMTGVCGSSFTTNFARGRINRSINGGSYTGIGAEFFLGGNFAATYGNRTTEEWTHDFLDSPNTTSQVTYQLYMKVLDGNAMYVGMWGQDVNWKQSTSITVMEIAG